MQGEGFEFYTPVPVDGPVEVWMTAVEKEMRLTLHRWEYMANVSECITAFYLSAVGSISHGMTMATLMHALPVWQWTGPHGKPMHV